MNVNELKNLLADAPFPTAKADARPTCPPPSRWWTVMQGNSRWTRREQFHLDCCDICRRTQFRFQHKPISHYERMVDTVAQYPGAIAMAACLLLVLCGAALWYGGTAGQQALLARHKAEIEALRSQLANAGSDGQPRLDWLMDLQAERVFRIDERDRRRLIVEAPAIPDITARVNWDLESGQAEWVTFHSHQAGPSLPPDSTASTETAVPVSARTGWVHPTLEIIPGKRLEPYLGTSPLRVTRQVWLDEDGFRLDREVQRVSASLDDLGLDRPCQPLDDTAFQPLKNKIDFRITINEAYIEKVLVNWGLDEDGRFLPVYQGNGKAFDKLSQRTIQVSSEELPKTFQYRQLQPRAMVVPYSEARQRFPSIFDKPEIVLSRQFLMTPFGLTPDSQLPTTVLEKIINDGHPIEKNRYTVFGRIPVDLQQDAPSYAYLVIYPQLDGQCTIGSVIVPSAGGVFYTRCFLGTSVDDDRYTLKVIVPQSGNARVYRPLDRFDKTKDWAEDGFRVLGGQFKVNDGQDGFDVID